MNADVGEGDNQVFLLACCYALSITVIITDVACSRYHENTRTKL
jgi:hypothetical protein